MSFRRRNTKSTKSFNSIQPPVAKQPRITSTSKLSPKNLKSNPPLSCQNLPCPTGASFRQHPSLPKPSHSTMTASHHHHHHHHHHQRSCGAAPKFSNEHLISPPLSLSLIVNRVSTTYIFTYATIKKG
ncbi:hypothetical protein M758_1G001800 [Ceratodon purpureus]|nr:hypothetical protein M758_1G001800 [Ceratodon purpureus]